MKDIEDSELRAYALQNITTLIPERHCHKFSVKEELARMEEALNLGYEDQEQEQPIDMRVLHKILNSKKVIKSGLNLGAGEPGSNPSSLDRNIEAEQKIVTNPQLAVKLFNKKKAYKEKGDVTETGKTQRRESDSSEMNLLGEEFSPLKHVH